MRALVMVLVLAVAQAGCSVLFVDGPRADRDAVHPRSHRPPRRPNFLLYIPMWIAGGADVVSSVIGISKVKRCRTTSHTAT